MRKTLPIVPFTDPNFKYRNSFSTDVRITWQKFGWKPFVWQVSWKKTEEHNEHRINNPRNETAVRCDSRRKNAMQ